MAERFGFEALGADEGDEIECYKCDEAQLRNLINSADVKRFDDRIVWGAKDIAKAIGRSEKAVFAMLERGQCPGAKKIGGRWGLNLRVFIASFEEKQK